MRSGLRTHEANAQATSQRELVSLPNSHDLIRMTDATLRGMLMAVGVDKVDELHCVPTKFLRSPLEVSG